MLLDCGLEGGQSFQPFTTLGLLYDFAGALLMGSGFYSMRPQHYLVSSTPGARDGMMFTPVAKPAVDGIAGTVLLAVGFLFQFLGSLNWCSSLVVILGCPVLVLLLVVWLISRDPLAKKWETWLEKDPERLPAVNQKPGPDDQGTQ